MFAFLAFASCAVVMPHEERSFVAFMREHNLAYTGDEYNLRLGIFLANARRVADFNKHGKTFKVALNKFACLTPAEYRAMLGAKPPRHTSKNTKKATAAAPAAIDWRDKNVVNDVKDQGQCGSCWAFSCIGAQESQWAIATGTLQVLSESNIVDCVDTCFGCSGGWPNVAYDYVIQKQGGKFMLNDDYPYQPVQSLKCFWDASKGVQNIKSYIDVTEGDEDDLKEKVGNFGPASICIDASHWSFQLYAGGIYDESNCESWNLDHAVVCIGYGSEDNVDYWIVRNSWGSGWGEGGNVRMIRNKGNQCGEASAAIIPVDQ